MWWGVGRGARVWELQLSTDVRGLDFPSNCMRNRNDNGHMRNIACVYCLASCADVPLLCRWNVWSINTVT